MSCRTLCPGLTPSLHSSRIPSSRRVHSLPALYALWVLWDRPTRVARRLSEEGITWRNLTPHTHRESGSGISRALQLTLRGSKGSRGGISPPQLAPFRNHPCLADASAERLTLFASNNGHSQRSKAWRACPLEEIAMAVPAMLPTSPNAPPMEDAR